MFSSLSRWKEYSLFPPNIREFRDLNYLMVKLLKNSIHLTDDLKQKYANGILFSIKCQQYMLHQLHMHKDSLMYDSMLFDEFVDSQVLLIERLMTEDLKEHIRIDRVLVFILELERLGCNYSLPISSRMEKLLDELLDFRSSTLRSLSPETVSALGKGFDVLLSQNSSSPKLIDLVRRLSELTFGLMPICLPEAPSHALFSTLSNQYANLCRYFLKTKSESLRPRIVKSIKILISRTSGCNLTPRDLHIVLETFRLSAISGVLDEGVSSSLQRTALKCFSGSPRMIMPQAHYLKLLFESKTKVELSSLKKLFSKFLRKHARGSLDADVIISAIEHSQLHTITDKKNREIRDEVSDFLEDITEALVGVGRGEFFDESNIVKFYSLYIKFSGERKLFTENTLMEKTMKSHYRYLCVVVDLESVLYEHRDILTMNHQSCTIANPSGGSLSNQELYFEDSSLRGYISSISNFKKIYMQLTKKKIKGNPSASSTLCLLHEKVGNVLIALIDHLSTDEDILWEFLNNSEYTNTVVEFIDHFFAIESSFARPPNHKNVQETIWNSLKVFIEISELDKSLLFLGPFYSCGVTSIDDLKEIEEILLQKLRIAKEEIKIRWIASIFKSLYLQDFTNSKLRDFLILATVETLRKKKQNGNQVEIDSLLIIFSKCLPFVSAEENLRDIVSTISPLLDTHLSHNFDHMDIETSYRFISLIKQGLFEIKRRHVEELDEIVNHLSDTVEFYCRSSNWLYSSIKEIRSPEYGNELDQLETQLLKKGIILTRTLEDGLFVDVDAVISKKKIVLLILKSNEILSGKTDEIGMQAKQKIAYLESFGYRVIITRKERITNDEMPGLVEEICKLHE